MVIGYIRVQWKGDGGWGRGDTSVHCLTKLHLHHVALGNTITDQTIKSC